MPWYFGYMQKPDGSVRISDAFDEPEHAYAKQDSIRASDIRLSTLIIATSDKQALSEAKQILRRE